MLEKSVIIKNMQENEEELREKMKEIATEYLEKGDATGWFDAIYRETEGDSELIPWVDFEPNRFLVEWENENKLEGKGRKALVVGCGLGDEAKFLYERDFDVTAFDISEKAIEIAKRIHKNTDIKFQVADLFNPPKEFRKAFDLVLEVYTIQALPPNLREEVMAKITSFVAENGELIAVQRFRENGIEPEALPWALSPNDLSNFDKNGLTQTGFSEYLGDEEEPIKRFVTVYER